MKNEIKKQVKWIYKSIDELNAYNPYRTNRTELERIAGTTSKIYLLIDISDAARNDGILTSEEYHEIVRILSEALAILTRKSNANFEEYKKNA